ncbi:hypothetical protein [Lysinibacillus sp. RS5]|uniref:hypothetical protein n=1 Tax=unclassified Lysinibacillus TaxID=2636778 RepID=UPI0035BE5267
MGSFSSGGVMVSSKNRKVAFGSKVVDFHPKMTGHSIKTVNGKCYIDGYEFVRGKWRKTFLATWHKLF